MQGARSVFVDNGAAKLPNLTPHLCNDEDSVPLRPFLNWSSKHHHKMASIPNIGVSLSIMYPQYSIFRPVINPLHLGIIESNMN